MTGLDEIARLRSQFDAAFAQPRQEPPAAGVGVIVVRVGDAPHALLLDGVAGIHALGRVAPVPADDPALLGIVATRLALAPVHRLAALLGIAAAGAPRLLVLLRHRHPLGVAVEGFVAYERIAADAVRRRPAGADAPLLAGHVAYRDGTCPLIDAAVLITRIDRSVPTP